MRKRSFLTKGVPDGLLKDFDKKIQSEERFTNRSEVIRELMRVYVLYGIPLPVTVANLNNTKSRPDAQQPLTPKQEAPA
jgi:hypothetical protein